MNFAVGAAAIGLIALGSLAKPSDRPTDQQLDQVVMAIQGLATHREPVIRGREILRGVLYRWGNGQ
jgi:hypothetical protein